jgi:hypothetical protein
MAKHVDLVGIVTDLDRYIAILETGETSVAALCLRMARMELQMKIHNITNEEFEALCDLMESTLASQPPGGIQ